MVIVFLFAQALCPGEDRIMEKNRTDWYSKPVFHVMQGVSYAGHPVISGTTPFVLYQAGEYTTAQHSYLGLFINCATVLPMQYVINRRRPNGTHLRWDASFPSGHTTCIFTQAYVLSHHYPKYRVPALAFASAVGLSRIYIQKHYPTDVLAGAAIGLLTGFLVTSLCD